MYVYVYAWVCSLENALRLYSALTEGDVISVHHNGIAYALRVVSTQPASAVCIIDTDLTVEFVAPPAAVAAPLATTDTQTASAGTVPVMVERPVHVPLAVGEGAVCGRVAAGLFVFFDVRYVALAVACAVCVADAQAV